MQKVSFAVIAVCESVLINC